MFETRGQMYDCGHGWRKMCTRAWTSPVFIAWVKTKSNRDQWALRAAEQWGLRCSYHQANPGLFSHVCMMQGWQIGCLTELLLSSMLCREMPTRICVDPGSEFCVWGTVCSVYYKIDLSVNDADLYHGSVCLERKPWGDILCRALWFLESVFGISDLGKAKPFRCCLCPP